MDDWNVMGLKGTGSVSYSVNDLFVPEDFSFTRESRRRPPRSRTALSVLDVQHVRRRLLRRGARHRAARARRLHQAGDGPRSRYAAATLLSDNNTIQSQVGLSEARLQSSRAYVIETYRRLYGAVEQGLRFTPEMRIANRIVTCYAIQQAREVMNFVYHAAGATAIFEGNPFERRFRDLNTVTQQGQAAFSNFESLGQTLMGLPPSRPT